jgi:ferredoxin-type protein NapF
MSTSNMPAVDTAKRALFRGRVSPVQLTHRLPWKVVDFTDRCERCGECVDACPESILVIGDGGFPDIDFARGGCTFCGACEAACRHGALVRSEGEPGLSSLVASISEHCLSVRGITCRSCAESCDPRAIRFRLAVGGKAIPELNGSICNGCGSCVSTCPVQAIQMEEAA